MIKFSKKKIIIIIAVAGILAGAIGILALNGYFGGGAAIPEDTMTRGLVGYWSFDEGSGNTAYDASGAGNHGTISGANWTKGKISGALTFDGADDYVNIGQSSTLNVSNITVESWVNYDSGWPVGATIAGRDDSTNRVWSFYQFDSSTLRFFVFIGDVAKIKDTSLSPVPGQWYHLVGTYDGSNVRIYINGKDVGSPTAATGNIDTDAADIRIGDDLATSHVNWKGLIDEVRIYNRALSAEEIRYHYNRGGPVAHWKFDEGSGSTAYDATENNNDGTLTNMDNSDWVPGKYGTALDFDGSDDYVDCGNDNSLDFTSSNSYTWTAWITPHSVDAGFFNSIISKFEPDMGGNGGYLIYMDADRKLSFVEEKNLGNISCSKAMTLNQKYFISVTYQNGAVEVFLDGSSCGSGSVTAVSDTTSNLIIGDGGMYGEWDGVIDDAHIYNYARTADEIRLDFQAGYAVHFGPSNKTCSEDPASCMNEGLVGYWGFDESSGTKAYDSSDSGNHGTLTNGPKWTKGKISGGLSFDGTDDRVDCGSGSSLAFGNVPFSIEAWIYPFSLGTDSYGNTVFGKHDGSNNGYYLRLGSNDFSFTVGTGTGFDEARGGTPTKNTWYHLVGKYSPGTGLDLYVNGVFVDNTSTTKSSTSPGTARIGIFYNGADRQFHGIIDEVRIYNRALSAEEVRYHYNRGGPVAHWKFDEGSGTTAYDETENNNDGTLFNSPTWTTGKYGSALDFDGTDDYAAIGDLGVGNNYTAEAWIKPDQLTGGNTAQQLHGFTVMASSTGSGTGYPLWLTVKGTEVKLWAYETTNDGGARTTNGANLTTGNWFHITATAIKSGATKVYVNGMEKLSFTNDGECDWNNIFTIGDLRPDRLIGFNGTIDDVRVFNYIRTVDQIQQDYQSGTATHLGPSGKTCSEDPASCMDYGLVGYWNMNEGVGITAYDSSDSGNNGTLTNGPKWTRGKISGGLQFDGTDDYVSIVDSASLDLTGSITIGAFVNVSSLASLNPIITKRRTSGGSEPADDDINYFLTISTDGKVSFTYRDSVDAPHSYSTNDSLISTDSYYFVMFSYTFGTASSAKMYVNGTLKPGSWTQGTGNSSAVTNNWALTIGKDYYCATPIYRYFKGAIDEVRIYNRALSAEEVRYHYNRGAPVAHWKFDEGEGTIAYDESGNNNKGTLTNSPTWVSGKYGSALSFDGSDDYVEATVSQTKTSYALWIKPNGQDWQHIAKISSTYYINGTPGTLTYFPVYVSGNTVQIGKTDASTYFNGLIDDVRIYNYARTAEQIKMDYQQGVATHIK